MASRRGMSNSERLALDMATVTADASLVLSPCYLYSAVFAVIDVSATGSVSLADSSASGDADKETSKIEIKLGSGSVSAAGWPSTIIKEFNPPVHIANTLVADITNATCSVTYLPR